MSHYIPEPVYILTNIKYGSRDQPKNGIQNLQAFKTHLRIVLIKKTDKMHWHNYTNTIPLSNTAKSWIFIPICIYTYVILMFLI